jgi:DNA-binding PadR family transcriptional regulator
MLAVEVAMGDRQGGTRVSVRYGLLALLAEAPTHGYQLKTSFERRTGGSWQLNIGQVYTTLQRLARDGLVEEIEGTEGDRRAYRITDVGRTQLESWFVTPVLPEAPARDELTIKVLLAVAAGDVDVTNLLQRQRRASIEQLQAYTRRKAKADPVLDLAFLLLLDALIFRTEAEIRWLDACDARIRSVAPREETGR